MKNVVLYGGETITLRRYGGRATEEKERKILMQVLGTKRAVNDESEMTGANIKR